MNTYLTGFKAINPDSGELETYCGANVIGISFKDAQEYCDNNGLGYCNVVGVLVAEIPCDNNYKADFSRKIDYENVKLN